MRNKLGIYQLDLPSITLDFDIDTGDSMEITDLLTKEQKEIIKKMGGSKLVYLHIPSITDSASHEIIEIRSLLTLAGESLQLFFSAFDIMYYLQLYELSDAYFIGIYLYVQP